MSLKPSHNQPKVNVRSSFPPHSKGSSVSSTGHQNKNSNNSNQSANAKTNLHNTKVNKSKPVISHNAHNAKQQGSQGQGHKKPINKPGIKAQDGGKTGNHPDINTLRNSLTEDIPRRELATTAEPQE